VEAIFTSHPAIVQKLLSYTDTPLCEPRQKLSTIEQAITSLGAEQVRDLALKVALLECTESAINVNLISIENFWRHSLYCAIAARSIAQHLGMPDYRDFFLMGLLHDIGKLLMYIALPQKSNEWVSKKLNSGTEHYFVEKHVYGFDHTEVGHLILNHWHLPEKINATVTYHHKPGAAGDYARHASIIYVANGISNALAPLIPEDSHVTLNPTKAAEILDADDEALAALIEAIDKEFLEVDLRLEKSLKAS
jgi:putative nucleotidyltransferase with HDIG domain